MEFKGNSKSLENQFMAARNVIHKRLRMISLYTVKQLASEMLCILSLAASRKHLSEEQITHFSALSRAEILCEVASRTQKALTQNNLTYGVKETRFFDPSSTLRKNVARLTREQLCESYGIKDELSFSPDKKVNSDDVLYGRFLRENGLSDRPGAEITEEDDPMDVLTALAILGFFVKPKTVQQATDEAARAIIKRDMVNPQIIDSIIRSSFGSLYSSTPDAHERVLQRAREIFREQQ